METITTEHVSCAFCGENNSTLFADGFDYQYWTSKQKWQFVQCSQCGHVYLNPRPSPDESDKIYPSNYYTLEGRHTKSQSTLIAKFKEYVIWKRLAYFDDLFSSGANIIEIGSGDCSLLIQIKNKYPNCQVTGIDLSFSDNVKRTCEEVNIRLFEEPIERSILPDNSFDLVIMNQVIEHLWQPSQVIDNIVRMLKKGGHLSIETPNLSGYDQKLFARSHWGGYYFPRHLQLFGHTSLKNILENRGMSVLKQFSLVAPIIWAFSVHSAINTRFNHQHRPWFVDRLLSDRNPACLGFFTIIDMIARMLGFTTSNQKIIAIKN